uniref:Uncharacterized protein n=1 Tax=Anopheles arabiensis TaxID=7173 RepID=A0A182IGE8_ANOAR
MLRFLCCSGWNAHFSLTHLVFIPFYFGSDKTLMACLCACAITILYNVLNNLTTQMMTISARIKFSFSSWSSCCSVRSIHDKLDRLAHSFG